MSLMYVPIPLFKTKIHVIDIRTYTLFNTKIHFQKKLEKQIFREQKSDLGVKSESNPISRVNA